MHFALFSLIAAYEFVQLIGYQQTSNMINRDQDYFKSPCPKNFDYFSYANEKIHDEGEQLFENNFYGNLSKDPKSPFIFQQHRDSPFHLVTPINNNNSRIFPGDKYVNNFGITPISEKEEKSRHKTGHHVINEKLNFSESDQSELIETPCKPENENANQGNHTTATKKYDLRFVGSATSRKTTRQNQRGLRVLSKLAYQIVLQSGPTTYKEVADKLISEQNEEEKMDDKQRQNIKRRVYDALNVLIALGQLDKKGRKIIKSKKRQKMEEEQNKLIQNKSKLLAKLKKRKDAVMEKKQEKQRILKLNKSLKKLIHININQRQSSEMINEEKLHFPLVFMEKALPEVKGMPSVCHFHSNGEDPIIVRGDSDVIGLLFSHQK